MINQRIEGTSKEDQAILNDMVEGIQGIESMNICVCSFSEERDSLSQWRAYGDSTSAYAIGFYSGHLAAMVALENLYLAPCLYRAEEKNALLTALVDEVFEENAARVRNGEQLWDAVKERGFKPDEKILTPRGGNLGAYLHRYAPILKDASFSEEREWRIISRPLMCTGERYGFRQGRSMIIPYYRFPLSATDQQIKIDEIVIGPTPHIRQSQRSVFSLLVSMDLDDHDPFFSKVNCSSIPYRSW